MSLSGSLLLLAALLPGQQPAGVIDQDFRSKEAPAAPLKFVPPKAGEWVKAEEEGLRVTLTANEAKGRVVAIASESPLVGDFEITASYEVLSVGQPQIGYGAGVNLTIQPDGAQAKLANVARYWLADGRDGYVARVKKNGNVNRPPIPTDAKTGRLRLKREGATVSFLVADGFDQPFNEIFKCDYGDDVVGLIRFVAGPGNAPVDLDVRLISLKIEPLGPSTAAATPSIVTRRSLFPLILILSALALLFGGSLWWIWRKRSVRQPIES